QTLTSMANASSFGYTQYTFDVVGTNGTSTLEFDANNSPDAFGLDDVTLTAVGSQATPQPPGASPGVPTITSFSPDTGVVGDGITDPAVLALTGTAVANSTVNVYDGTTLLGTTTASGTGAWSFTTVPLPDGLHHFTATDTVAGNTSAASAV